MAEGIEITAVICTHNRCRFLPLALKSLSEQTLDISRYEVITVDNASTDDTYSYLSQQIDMIPNLRVIQEPTKGVSNARNLALREARGKYIAFMDDDAIADPDWLANMLRAFEEAGPETALVGGYVEAIWEVPKPDWVRGKMLDFYTVVDWGPPQVVGEKRHLAGANLAYRRDYILEVGDFLPQLKSYCDETIVNRRLRRRGFLAYYDPRVRVRHHITAGRLTKKWICRRMFWGGASARIMARRLEMEGLPNAIPVEGPPLEAPEPLPRYLRRIEKFGRFVGDVLFWYWRLTKKM